MHHQQRLIINHSWHRTTRVPTLWQYHRKSHLPIVYQGPLRTTDDQRSLVGSGHSNCVLQTPGAHLRFEDLIDSNKPVYAPFSFVLTHSNISCMYLLCQYHSIHSQLCYIEYGSYDNYIGKRYVPVNNIHVYVKW